MVLNNNSSLSRELIEGGRLQGIQGVPKEIIDKIQPVMEVNPKLLRVCNFVRHVSSSATGTSTVISATSSFDVYITSINLNVAYDSAADSTTTYLIATVDGVSRTLIEIMKVTLTAQDRGVSLTFPIPLKIDRNTAVSLTKTFTVGTGKVACCIVGFTVDNITA